MLLNFGLISCVIKVVLIFCIIKFWFDNFCYQFFCLIICVIKFWFDQLCYQIGFDILHYQILI